MTTKTVKNTKAAITTGQLTKIALLIALISVASYLVIPLPFSTASISGQTIAVNLVAFVCTPLEAFLTILCYWLLGLAGAPVFAGTTGPARMFGPAGGYYMGFFLAVVLISLLKGKKYSLVRYGSIAIFVGIPIINGIGMIWMKVILGLSWKAAFLTGFLPFVPLDIVKCLAAAVIARPILLVIRESE